jgi:hypothetical protein
VAIGQVWIVTIEYEITFEDFVEAINAAQLITRHRGAAPQMRWAVWIILGVVLVFVLGLGIWGVRDQVRHDRLDLRQLAEDSAELAPWIAFAILSIGFRIAIHTGRRIGRVALACATFFLIVSAATILMYRSFRGVTAWLPWFFAGSMAVAYWRYLLGNQSYRRAWRLQSHVHGPRSLVASDDGIVIADAITSLNYHWPAIQKWGETGSLFLLFVSGLSFHMVPKRAFGSAGALDSFRQMLANATERGERGFPVLAAQAPRPVEKL